jgi:hypothetical protein
MGSAAPLWWLSAQPCGGSPPIEGLAGPLPTTLPVFPYTGLPELGGNWTASRLLWLVVALVAAILLAAALLDARWRSATRPRSMTV